MCFYFQDESAVTIQQCPSPVTEGDNTILYCNVAGNPVPSTAWIRTSTGEVLSYSDRLVIDAIERNESGSYECLAWNGIGNNNSKSCIIDVHLK